MHVGAYNMDTSCAQAVMLTPAVRSVQVHYVIHYTHAHLELL